MAQPQPSRPPQPDNREFRPQQPVPREDAGAPTGIEAALADLERDGLIERQGSTFRVTPLGRPFVRQVCAAFDAYLAPGALKHSVAV